MNKSGLRCQCSTDGRVASDCLGEGKQDRYLASSINGNADLGKAQCQRVVMTIMRV